MCPIQQKDYLEDPCDQQLLHWKQEFPEENNSVPVLSYESLLDCSSFLLSLYCVAAEDAQAKAQKQGMRSMSSEAVSAVCESVGYPERSSARVCRLRRFKESNGESNSAEVSI